MGGKLRIVVAEPNSSYAEQIVRELKKGTPAREITVVQSAKTLATALQEKTDVLIAAFGLPDLTGLDILRIMRDKELAIPVIIFFRYRRHRNSRCLLKKRRC